MQCCNLSGKTAIITGASKGIGKAIALHLASCGANISLVARNQLELDKVKNKILDSGGQAQSLVGDVSNLDSFNEIVSLTMEKWNDIHILVNNAGVTKDNIIMRMTEKEWQTVIDVNLKGCFNGIKAVSKQMMKKKYGKIINITSVIGLIGNSGQGNYSSAKAGILGLTKSIAKELGSRNITINAVAPGYIETEMTEKLDPKIKTNLKQSIPLNRFGTVNDVANLVCFLISDDANYITGQTFNVDGGMVMI
ncbi:MAG: 3-oxoacyl-[acyl-carrier-protein] reductase [Candidatus Neomarinimicrobiota bacterium]|nr:3-oxoacyl-[acyl-carrier-protein] reductase [Candidatus Neomarinimicrobiota bacterium]|tara:strand:- start:854 stop:1606 length:753 start_codon:yes stop_codon:yes gene_type:complete